MKVADLIKKLQGYPADTEVILLDDDLQPRHPAIKETRLEAPGSPSVLQVYVGGTYDPESVYTAVSKAWRGG